MKSNCEMYTEIIQFFRDKEIYNGSSYVSDEQLLQLDHLLKEGNTEQNRILAIHILNSILDKKWSIYSNERITDFLREAFNLSTQSCKEITGILSKGAGNGNNVAKQELIFIIVRRIIDQKITGYCENDVIDLLNCAFACNPITMPDDIYKGLVALAKKSTVDVAVSYMTLAFENNYTLALLELSAILLSTDLNEERLSRYCNAMKKLLISYLASESTRHCYDILFYLMRNIDYYPHSSIVPATVTLLTQVRTVSNWRDIHNEVLKKALLEYAYLTDHIDYYVELNKQMCIVEEDELVNVKNLYSKNFI